MQVSVSGITAYIDVAQAQSYPKIPHLTTEPLSCPSDGLNTWSVTTFSSNIAIQNRVTTGNVLDVSCDKARSAKY